MQNTKFQFSKIQNREVATFDNSLSNFFSQGIEGTIKEDVQNSLDAKLDSDEDPVKLKITLSNIQKKDIPGIDEVFEHIDSLEGANSYTKETIKYMKDKKRQSSIPTLTIEDMNTKGLSGAVNGQSNNSNDTFGVYAYNKGVHSINQNTSIEISRGGSHGIGKIANNAASDLHLMYFANCDEFDNQHLGGTVHLIEHEYNDQYYRSTGYFTDTIMKDGKIRFQPYENNGFSSVFSKETRGLKIIIPYLRNEFNDLKKITKAICDNFFVAILKNKLDITIEADEERIEINHYTLEEIVSNNQFYNTDITKMKKNFTPLYVNTYLNEEPFSLEINNNLENYNFNLYFTYDEDIVTGRVAIVRTIGMKIEDFKVKNNVRRPFNAIIIGGPKEDEYLKSLENESHSKISADDIRDTKEKKNAKKFISNLNKKIAEIISEYVEKNNPTDGFINTDDLIFETDMSFSKDVYGTSDKVSVSTKEPVLKKTNKKEKRKSKEYSTTNNTGTPKNNRKRIPRKLQNDDKESDNLNKYIVSSDVVERVVMNNYEILKINLKGFDQSSNWSKCNLAYRVVDGMGMEYSNEIDLLESYSQITQVDGSIEYNFKTDKIEDIEIVNEELFLKLYLNDNFNKHLKFLYVVEVKNDI